MDIIMSYDNNKVVKIFPVVPRDIEIEQTQKNEIFETINTGELNIIGDLGLRSLRIESIFPNNSYSWIRKGSSPDGWGYVEFINYIRNKKIPARIIIGNNEKEWINMACTIDTFNHRLMPSGDIKYSMVLKEYKFVKVS